MDRTNWLTAREVRRSMYRAEDGDGGHDEVVVPEWTSRPCGCVVTKCPRCAPLQFDDEGNYIRQGR